MQKIITKNHGSINFIKTWVDGNIHIGITESGDYRHIGGPPVTALGDLGIISDAKHREAAEKWFDETYNKKPVPVEVAHEETVPMLVPNEKQAYAKKLKAVLPKTKAVDKKVCPICGKIAANSAALQGHMRSHAKDIPEPAAEVIDE